MASRSLRSRQLRRVFGTFVIVVASGALGACGERATLPVSAGFGPTPALPLPHRTLFPTVNVAPAKGWPPGITPTAAPGLSVSLYAANLAHPRWL